MFTIESQEEAPRAVLTINEACATLQVSRWSLYKLIRERQLDTIRIGRRRLIPATEIQALIERLRGEEYF